MNRLSVNIDHVATVRQARQADEPDPVWAAVEAELGGADGITFHLREDRRHINDRDAEALRRSVRSGLNMEMSSVAEVIEIALRLRPDMITLVPERREELTTEGGLDVVRFRDRLTPLVRQFADEGIPATAFIEPLNEQIDASRECGFGAAEIWTGGYAHAKSPQARHEHLDRLAAAIERGFENDLIVRAGHGLTYKNVGDVARLGGFEEFNIGHSIVSRALMVGMRAAVQEMKRILDSAKLDLAVMQNAQQGHVHHDPCGHDER